MTGRVEFAAGPWRGSMRCAAISLLYVRRFLYKSALVVPHLAPITGCPPRFK